MSNLPIMSVSGIRGKFPEQLGESFIAAIAYIQTQQCGGGTMIIGRDTRPTGALLERAACRGIRAAGGRPVSIGIAPTPTTCFAVDHAGAAGGIILTASHNPLPYNGYKMVHGEGRLFSGAECDAVYAAYHAGKFPALEELTSFDDTPAEEMDAVTPHIEAIVNAVDADTIRAAELSVAVDAINGAAGVIFPALLERLGVTWKGVHTKLDGNFVHNPEPRPEHLGDLAALLRSMDDVRGGFVFDPDADRCATMGEKGEPISEEMTLVLAMENILHKTPGPVATNLSTSMVIDDVASHFGVVCHRTKIGEANVVEAIHAQNCIIGGEGNGGVIYPAVSTVRDGLTAMALILEQMAVKKMPLTALTAPWPVYPIVKEKIELGDKNPAEAYRAVEDAFPNATKDTQDGIKLIYPDGWVHLRASNTEPILRCYAEGKDEATVRKYADSVMAVL
ncbi:MAG: phosphoglucosamine mutase [Fibrobacterota bacterium]